MFNNLIFTFILLFSSLLPSFNALSHRYYDHTCPNLESIVAREVHLATANDKTVPAALLRMHFHDCFIRVIKSLYTSNTY